MASELPEGGLYFQIKKEDLANAPPGVTEFLLKLTSQNSDKTGCQDRREAVTGLAQSNSLSERLEFLTGTLQMLAEQPELPETIHDTPWADFVNKIDILIAAVENFRTWQNGDPTNLPIDVSLQGCESKQAGELDIQPEVQTESDSSKPGEALSFDHDVVIVDAVEAADKHNQNLKPVTHKRLPNRCQDNELVTDVSQACALQGTSSAPINVELLPAEDASLRMPIPDFCGSDSDILENLVQFGMKNWPQKTFDYFRPGKHATAGILNDLLRTNLPVQFALGVPPHRVNNLEETFAGIVMPFHVNETNQISNIESEKNHFVIAIVDKQNKTFTSWGMSRIMHQESQVAYEEALGIRLAGIRNKLGDYTGNCCAFRCVEAMRSYFKVETITRSEVPLRLFFLEQLVRLWTHDLEAQAPGESVLAITPLSRSQPLPVRGQPDQTFSGIQHTQRGISASCDSPLETTLTDSDLSFHRSPHPNPKCLLDPIIPAVSPPPATLKQLVLDTSLSKSSGTKAIDRADRFLSPPRPESARISLPGAGRNHQAPPMQPDDLNPNVTACWKTIDTKVEGRKHSKAYRRDELQSPRKRSSKASTSTPGRETDSAPSEPLPKRQVKSPTLKILAEELIGPAATDRIRCHVLTCNQEPPNLPRAWDEQRDWFQQTGEFLNLAKQWSETSEFNQLVALILNTHAVEIIYIKAWTEYKPHQKNLDFRLPTAVLDKLTPHLQRNRSRKALQNWLLRKRKLLRLKDYLPFLPFRSRGPTTFRDYERLPAEDIKELCKLLDNGGRAKILAKVGRVFRDRILKRQTFLWENISYEELSKVPDDTLLHLLTIRRGAEYDQLRGKWSQSHNEAESSTLHSIIKQCDLCEGEVCKLLALGQDLASKQLMIPAREHSYERAASTDAAKHNKIATGGCQIWISEISAPVSSLKMTDYDPSTAQVTSIDSLASQSLSPISNAFWQAEYAYILNNKPQQQLVVPVMVPDTAQSIVFAMKGDIDGLKYLFSLGQASPNDTSHSRGFSLLRWALYGGHSGMHHYETIQFLLDHGAHVDDESYKTVGNYNLSKKYDNVDRQVLRCLARKDRNWFNEQNFSLIHKIIFGLRLKSLADELLQNPNAVLATDAQGRTALDWATARAQLSDMKLLIAYGSDPNSMDIDGRTTILHAVDSYNTEALRIILEAGADPEPHIPKGLLRGNPLTSAILNSLPGMVKLLIEFGAKIDATNPEGLTALHSAAVSQNPECASILLEHDADITHMSSNGCTPLMTAIIHNSHAVLRLFLGKHVGCLNGSQLLPIVAEHADSETMSILASSQIFGISGDCLPADRVILLCRKDYNEMLGHAFESLVSVWRCNEYNLPPSPVASVESE